MYNAGSTVLEMVAAFEKACGKKVPYKVRMPGLLVEPLMTCSVCR
jgi:hypothetical protein